MHILNKTHKNSSEMVKKCKIHSKYFNPISSQSENTYQNNRVIKSLRMLRNRQQRNCKIYVHGLICLIQILQTQTRTDIFQKFHPGGLNLYGGFGGIETNKNSSNHLQTQLQKAILAQNHITVQTLRHIIS